MRLHWHRRDLRASDNRGLAAGAEAGSVLPVFVFDPDVLDHAASPRVASLCDALDHLRERYRERGGDLLVTRGDPAECLPDLAETYGAEGVTYNHDYTGLAKRRDERVREALDDAGIGHEGFHDAVHHEPGTITTNDDDPYAVFTYFGDKWLDREKAAPVAEPDADALVTPESNDERDENDQNARGAGLPTLEELEFETPDADLPEAGTEAARERLDAFCAGPIFEYADAREHPDRGGTSRLSQDLKYGTIGIREVSERIAEAMAEAGSDEERESVETYREQLAWREFYTQVLDTNPSVVVENYKEYENRIEWREDEEDLAAWKEGETGYPIVDAGMRQLRAEAYMHNRVRMIVASFLTKDLLLDWRAGYAHFRERLVDHDTANDNGGWQWAASTGTDAQPYFRVFNPMTQGERYDPDAEYIKHYIPELDEVDPDAIHSWHELGVDERDEAAPEYPAPICDHGQRREDAIEMFERARGEE